MPDCFIYDHVRTPRGKRQARWRAPSRDRARACDPDACGGPRPQRRSTRAQVDDVVLGCVDPVGEAGGDIARAAVLNADYAQTVAGMQINRFCASGLDAVNFAAAQIMAGAQNMAVGGRRRIDEPDRHRRFRRRLAGRSGDRDQELLSAARHIRRSHRHQIRLSAAMTSMPMRSRARSAPPHSWANGYFAQVGGSGEGRHRPHHPRAR